MSEEKRRYVRWRKKIRVTYSLVEGEELFKEVFTENISEVGLQILTGDTLSPCQAITLKIEFVYDPVPVIAAGKVVYVTAFNATCRVGLEFVNMNDFERIRLKQNIDRIKQESENEVR